jgi:AcrR family transcriptional regulator
MNQTQTADPSTAGTPESLLLAGRKLFAHYGFRGASVRAITSEANANLGAITYHYGSKRALYERVVESYVQPLVEEILGVARRPGPVFDRLEQIVRAYFDYFAKYPETLQLMMQELALGGSPPEAALGRIKTLHHGLAALVHEGQASGEIRPGNPAIMAISIVSQPAHMMLMRRPLQAFTGMDLGDADTREQFVRNAAAFVRGGLATRREDKS